MDTWICVRTRLPLTLLSADRHDHVTPILATLDVKSRSAATDYAHRHDLA